MQSEIDLEKELLENSITFFQQEIFSLKVMNPFMSSCKLTRVIFYFSFYFILLGLFKNIILRNTILI